MDEFLGSVKGGQEIMALVVAIAAVVAAFVPTKKMPSWLGKAINTLAFNFGHAKNKE